MYYHTLHVYTCRCWDFFQFSGIEILKFKPVCFRKKPKVKSKKSKSCKLDWFLSPSMLFFITFQKVSATTTWAAHCICDMIKVNESDGHEHWFWVISLKEVTNSYVLHCSVNFKNYSYLGNQMSDWHGIWINM